MSIDKDKLKQILEGAILVAGEPMSVERLQKLFAENECPKAAEIKAALNELQGSFTERGVELVEVASGFRFQVKQDLAPWIARMWDEKPPRYSRALLETLVLIAYRQPITRAEIEDVRGVAVSTGIIKTLLDREWVRVVGHRDVPGKPSLYATTRKFLDYFNLKSLEELPTLNEIQDLDDPALNAQMDLVDEVANVEAAQNDADLADDSAETEEMSADVESADATQDSETVHEDDLLDNVVENIADVATDSETTEIDSMEAGKAEMSSAAMTDEEAVEQQQSSESTGDETHIAELDDNAIISYVEDIRDDSQECVSITIEPVFTPTEATNAEETEATIEADDLVVEA